MSEIPDVLKAVRDAGLPVSRIPGFAVAFELEPGASAMAGAASRALDAFEGPYGGERRSGSAAGLEWAAVLPGPEQTLTSWAAWRDSRGVCFVEGELYSDAFGKAPRTGLDEDLGRALFEGVLDRGAAAVAELNGTFSGFVYSERERRLWIFVDRVGARYVFYRKTPSGWAVASDLHGLRAFAPRLRVDPLSLNEHLTLGSALDGRTIFQDVRLVPPGHAVEIRSGAARETSYYELPRRRDRQSVRDGAAQVSDAIDLHVRDLANRSGSVEIALSGGKDSRVVLAGLLRCGLSATATTFATGPKDSDAGNAVALAAKAGIPLRRIAFAPAWSESAFDWDSSVMSFGYVAAWGFLALSAAASLTNRVVLTGFTGDVISGSTSALTPWKERTLEGLARAMLRTADPPMTPALAAAALAPELRVPFEDVASGFVAAFCRRRAGLDPMTAYIAHRLSHRNRWRPATAFHMMRIFAIPVHPFADRRVLDAYLELPLGSLVGQRVHGLAAMRGAPALGLVATGASPVPLRFEAPVSALLAPLKRAVNELRKRRPDRARRAQTGPSPRIRRLLEAAAESDLFTRSLPGLPDWRSAARSGAAVKIGATAIHHACATGATLAAAPAPLFLGSDFEDSDRRRNAGGR